MSIPDNLIEIAQTTLVQARGLDKPHRLVIPSPVEVTTPNIGQTHIHDWGLVKATTSDIQQSLTLNNLFRLQPGSELGGLMYYPRSTKYTWNPT